MKPHDKILLQMEQEEKRKKEREELEENLIRIAMLFTGILIGLVLWNCSRGTDVQAAVLEEARRETTQAEEVPPDAIWASDATYAPVEGITMVEPVPIETEPEVDKEELYMLAHLLAGECQSYSRECQEAVGSVVLNRVKSHRYPNTIEGVIFQRGQYACTRNGMYDREPTARNWEVAEYLLRNGSQLPANIYFQSTFKQGDFVYARIDGEVFCGLEE